jgi:hypothetical protein
LLVFFSFLPTHIAISAPTVGSEFPPAPARWSRSPAEVTRLPKKDRAWSSSREQAWSSSRAHGAHASAWRGTGPRPSKPEVASHGPELASPVGASPSSSSRARTQGSSHLGRPRPLDLEGWESRGYARNIPHCDVRVPLRLRNQTCYQRGPSHPVLAKPSNQTLPKWRLGKRAPKRAGRLGHKP